MLIDNNSEVVPITVIKPGEVFLYDDEYWMKINMNDYKLNSNTMTIYPNVVVNLANGNINFFTDQAWVSSRPNATLVMKDNKR